MDDVISRRELGVGGAERQKSDQARSLVLRSGGPRPAVCRGWTAQMLPRQTLKILVGIMSAIVGVIHAGGVQENVIPIRSIEPGVSADASREESGGVVTYRVKRLPVGGGPLFASFIAGNVSSLARRRRRRDQRPVLNACAASDGAAAATSAFMIGVTRRTAR